MFSDLINGLEISAAAVSQVPLFLLPIGFVRDDVKVIRMN